MVVAFQHPVEEVLPDRPDFLEKRQTRFGEGVFATRDLPAFTSLGAYPGRVYRMDVFDELVSRGQRSNKFALFFFAMYPDGNFITQDEYDSRGKLLFHGWLLDPSTRNPKTRAEMLQVDPRYANSFTPYLNEPAPGQSANTCYVMNLVRNRMELWTYEPVRRGEELLLCYGDSYDRTTPNGTKYTTGCTSQAPLFIKYDNSGKVIPWRDFIKLPAFRAIIKKLATPKKPSPPPKQKSLNQLAAAAAAAAAANNAAATVTRGGRTQRPPKRLGNYEISAEPPPFNRLAAAAAMVVNRVNRVQRPPKRFRNEDPVPRQPPQPPPQPQQQQQAQNVYVIEKFVNVDAAGKKYKVRWQGFDPSTDTWEPAARLKRDLGAPAFDNLATMFNMERRGRRNVTPRPSPPPNTPLRLPQTMSKTQARIAAIYRKRAGAPCPVCGEKPLPLAVVVSSKPGRPKDGEGTASWLTKNWAVAHQGMSFRDLQAVHGITPATLSRFERSQGIARKESPGTAIRRSQSPLGQNRLANNANAAAKSLTAAVFNSVRARNAASDAYKRRVAQALSQTLMKNAQTRLQQPRATSFVSEHYSANTRATSTTGSSKSAATANPGPFPLRFCLMKERKQQKKKQYDVCLELVVHASNTFRKVSKKALQMLKKLRPGVVCRLITTETSPQNLLDADLKTMSALKLHAGQTLEMYAS